MKKVAISVMCAHQVLGLPISRNANQPFDSLVHGIGHNLKFL